MDELHRLTVEAFTATQAARRRMWMAQDLVARLRQRLSDAEASAAETERDYAEQHQFLKDSWSYLRTEIERQKHMAVNQDGSVDGTEVASR